MVSALLIKLKDKKPVTKDKLTIVCSDGSDNRKKLFIAIVSSYLVIVDEKNLNLWLLSIAIR